MWQLAVLFQMLLYPLNMVSCHATVANLSLYS